MRLEESLTDVERAETLEKLDLKLQAFVENLGFRAFNFLDVGPTHTDQPYYSGTSGKAWETEYAQNGFVRFDPAVSKARRTNLPFDWKSVREIREDARARSKSHEVMEAARDHGFTEGLVVPHHFVDEVGRPFSCLSVLFWSDCAADFYSVVDLEKHNINIFLFYWMRRKHNLIVHQRMNENVGNTLKPNMSVLGRRILSDRERDVLSWAARGKTTRDTSEILKISTETVDTHLMNARRKLGATNKSHAIALAIVNGHIDV
jgi:LuxR family transcriptional regulator, quorum-sensing system regulator BjaR1